jgi:ElaB/YqjD/DUF883 family membrane-anchored ribosome-binding protein
VTDEANATLSEASARSAQLVSEADAIMRDALENSSQQLEDANRTATNLINQSRRRAERLSRKAEGYALTAINDAEQRARRLQDEYDDINEFLDSLKSLMSTEAVVSVVESTALALSVEEGKKQARAAARKMTSDMDENTVDAELMEEDEQ